MSPRLKAKICGITNLKDALSAVSSGADAVGFIFYKKSPRYITAERAAFIISSLPKKVKAVGVFVNAKEEQVKKAAKLCGLGILQFHGNESLEFCKKFKGYKIIKAFRVGRDFNFGLVNKYPVWGCLFDKLSGKYGGTGKVFNWELLKEKKFPGKKVFLSGGINAGNLTKAFKKVKPDWVDVSTSLEKSAGEKDRVKITKFMRQMKIINRNR
ncbi:MAG: phosphoribosylanthranilate isomerase [Candidatus Omnitrophica bacterium]|jgi:phosphoribosylanthranilate isomerase|nr:phosphoribosylanthranilate isomerase [Candidatus Omnitrophota bacterium]